MTQRAAEGVGWEGGGREWARAAVCALLGLIALSVAMTLSLSIPGRVAHEREFLDARPCTAEQPQAGGGADCLRTVRGTVGSAEEVGSGKQRHFRVLLRPPVAAPADAPLDLDPDGDLAEVLEPGDELSVTVWRDLRLSVRHDRFGESLDPRPDEEVGPYVGAALTCYWLAVLGFVAVFGSASRARRAAAGRSFRPRVRFGPAKAIGVVGIPIVLGVLVGEFGDGWPAVATTATLTALVAVQSTIVALRADA